jgi:hypothetical protein
MLCLLRPDLVLLGDVRLPAGIARIDARGRLKLLRLLRGGNLEACGLRELGRMHVRGSGQPEKRLNRVLRQCVLRLGETIHPSRERIALAFGDVRVGLEVFVILEGGEALINLRLALGDVAPDAFGEIGKLSLRGRGPSRGRAEFTVSRGRLGGLCCGGVSSRRIGVSSGLLLGLGSEPAPFIARPLAGLLGGFALAGLCGGDRLR